MVVALDIAGRRVGVAVTTAVGVRGLEVTPADAVKAVERALQK